MLPHVLLLVCLVAGGAYAIDCDDNVYFNCMFALNNDLNLTDSKPYQRPAAFRNNVESLYQNSPNQGLRTVCKAFRRYKQCMGQNYQACMNAGNFVGIGTDAFSAYQYVSTFNTMHYTCGAGFQVYLANSKCMAAAWTGTSKEQLNACRTKFEVTSNAIPQDACLLANTYLNCWEQQFLSACGSNAKDTQFWGCEYGRVNMFTRFPACPNSCVLPHNGGVIGL